MQLENTGTGTLPFIAFFVVAIRTNVAPILKTLMRDAGTTALREA